MISTCNSKSAANVLRTYSAYDGDVEPIVIHSSHGVDVTEAVPKHCKYVVGNEHRLHKFDCIDAIDEVFCELSVIRKCKIV